MWKENFAEHIELVYELIYIYIWILPGCANAHAKEWKKKKKRKNKSITNRNSVWISQMMETEEHLAERSHNFKWKININYVIICFVLFALLLPHTRKKREKLSLPQRFGSSTSSESERAKIDSRQSRLSEQHKESSGIAIIIFTTSKIFPSL